MTNAWINGSDLKNLLARMIAQYNAAELLETDIPVILTNKCKYNLTLLVEHGDVTQCRYGIGNSRFDY